MDQTACLESYLFYRHERLFLEPRETTIEATDGYPLAASIFEPRHASTTAVIASATGVRRGYYAAFAEWLASRGTRVITFDYRGIGGSRPDRLADLEASIVAWGERDLAGVVAWAERRHERPAIIGHSVGGQLVGLLPDPSLCRTVVMVGSQCGDFRLWPSMLQRAWYGALWYALVPGVTSAMGYLPGSFGIGEDLPGGVARQWARWCRTPGYMVGGRAGHARREKYRRLRAPVLAFGFDDDDYAPPAAVSALLALYENATITRRQVPRSEASVGHFGFFRERFRKTFWEETARWLYSPAR